MQQDTKTDDDKPDAKAQDNVREDTGDDAQPNEHGGDHDDDHGGDHHDDHDGAPTNWVAWIGLAFGVVAIFLVLSLPIWQTVWNHKMTTVFAFLGDRHEDPQGAMSIQRVEEEIALLHTRTDKLHAQIAQTDESLGARLNRHREMIDARQKDVVAIMDQWRDWDSKWGDEAFNSRLAVQFAIITKTIDARFDGLETVAENGVLEDNKIDANALIALRDDINRLQLRLSGVETMVGNIRDQLYQSDNSVSRFDMVSNGLLMLQTAVSQGHLPITSLVLIEQLKIDPVRTNILRHVMGERNPLPVAQIDQLAQELYDLAPLLRNRTSPSTGSDVWSSIEARLSNVIQLRRADQAVLYDPLDDLVAALLVGDLTRVLELSKPYDQIDQRIGEWRARVLHRQTIDGLIDALRVQVLGYLDQAQ